METKQKTFTVSIPEGKKAVWNKQGILQLVDDGKEANEPKNVTERIKTFHDAYSELMQLATHNFYPAQKFIEEYDSVRRMGMSDDIVAYMQLRIITAALNEGWEPQFTKDEDRWFPYFDLFDKDIIDTFSDDEKDSPTKGFRTAWGGITKPKRNERVSGQLWPSLSLGFNNFRLKTMNTVMLNALKDKAHMTAVEHGFYEEIKSDAFYLGLVMSEAGEAINADRKGLHADTKGFEENLGMLPFEDIFKEHIKDSVEDEIADIVIRLLDFAGLKFYGLHFEQNYGYSNNVYLILEREGLSSALFQLNYVLGNLYDGDKLERGIGSLVRIYSDCFRKMTGSDKDLWWFVDKKMEYNEQRPKLNGKKY